MYKNYGNVLIYNVEKSCFIPIDERNKDYREYLAWVEEGNEAEFVVFDMV